MDGAAPADEDFESLPIEQRLGHKVGETEPCHRTRQS